jgi:hypothetical protein
MGSFFLLILILAACIYFLPAIIGRHKRNSGAIFALNLFAGWTFVGWIIALVWACTQDDSPTIVNNHFTTTTEVSNSNLDLLNRMRNAGRISNDEYWEERKRLNM